eukprot:5377666-Pleurochrysis_carterae.AAC.1
MQAGSGTAWWVGGAVLSEARLGGRSCGAASSFSKAPSCCRIDAFSFAAAAARMRERSCAAAS